MRVHTRREQASLKPVIHNVHILDASLSMNGPKYTNAINGINEELQKLKGDTEVDYTQTIVEFQSRSGHWNQLSGYSEETHINRRYFMKPISDCTTIAGAGANGNTPLYETIGTVIEELLAKARPGEKVLIKIFTDGEENSSRGRYRNPRDLKTLIDRVESDNDFTVTFMGTQFDVERVVRDTGINFMNTLVHDNSARGIAASYSMAADSTVLYRKSVSDGTYRGGQKADFFKSVAPNDKKIQEQAKQPSLTTTP